MTDPVLGSSPRPYDYSRRRIEHPRAHRLPEPTPLAWPSASKLWRARRGHGLVLIVDDSVHTREMYTEYLSFRGLGVVSAPDAETGIRLAETLRPDVIIMDISMPGLNGIAATQRLRLNSRTRRIPVIVLTGYAFRAIEQGALEAGADAFLTKPCLPEDLELRIRALLGPRAT